MTEQPPSDHRVSVVVPTWMRATWLERTLLSICAQSPPPDEVIVVGRRVDVEAQKVVEVVSGKYPTEIRWTEVDRPGHVAPIIQGVKEAGGDIIAFLDDDCEPDSGWLSALLEPFEDRRVVCTGGRVVTPGLVGRVPPDAGTVRWYGRVMGNIGSLEVNRPIDVDGVCEGNSAWRARVLRELRFDPVIDFDDAAMYGLDLSLQAREKDYRVMYTSRARVLNHEAPRDPSLTKSDRNPRIFSYCRNYTYIALRHYRGTKRILFLLWWCLVGEREAYGLAKAALDLLAMRERSVVDQTVAAFKGRYEGIRLWLNP